MENSASDFFDFFTRPILNSPYEIPTRHWELDEVTKQPTRRIVERRRKADFYTPIPNPRKQRYDPRQKNIFDGADEISTDEKEYGVTAIIDQIREHVGAWRKISDPSKWGVTPETARLLQHWRHYDFSGIRPFFCQVEAAETLIWLTEAAPNNGKIRVINAYLHKDSQIALLKCYHKDEIEDLSDKEYKRLKRFVELLEKGKTPIKKRGNKNEKD
ncbi:MAG: hypothetical protein LBG12_02520 [Synergistaceae bacterium]|jgi:hypothetical protein|nr:hypothetical protein [Synergistaceae bacterium]